jgi:hypothetical protein
MVEFTVEETDQGIRGAWALFCALEAGNYPLANEIQAEFDRTLHAGWPLVAAALRFSLLEHANGCDCGSDEWLERQRLESLEERPDD